MTTRGFTRCIKTTLLVFDILILLSGIIMLIGGSAVQARINNEYLAKTVGGYSTQAGSVICIIFGIAVLLFSILGLYAAVKDNQSLLMIYCGVMAIIFIIQFITGIVGLSVKNSDSFTSNVASIVKPEFAYGKDLTELNFYQRHFECCGWKNYSDYLNEKGEFKAPSSCCIKKDCDIAAINSTETAKGQLFEKGCENDLIKSFSKVIEAACGILITMSLITLTSVVLSLILMRQIKTSYQFSSS